ncbi:MAG: hypothetical protein ACXACF_07655 [Candidatus Hermodarchaeia archaeon]|jgi:hypothetical protein
MSQERRAGFIACICITFVFGIILILFSPIIGIFALIIMFLGIAIVYVYQTQDHDEPSLPPSLSSPLPDAALTSTETEEPRITESVQVELRDTTTEDPSPESPPIVTKPEAIQKSKREVSSEKLQKRIDELEKRVRLLKSQLAEEPVIDTEVTHLTLDSPALVEEEQDDEDEDLSELAVRQLLEALDEKLAKRAISKQLYNRLRNKYLARLEKKERRSVTSSKRGRKESATGD